MNPSRWYAALKTALRSWYGRARTDRAAHEAASSERQAVGFSGELPRETYGRIEPVLTHVRPGEDRRRRLCRCSACGVVRRCTPDFDFYGTQDRAPLLCHNCFCELVLAAQLGGTQA